MHAFLAQRTPPSLVTRRRSNSATHPYANIAVWASKVQPGSPAPCSPPHRRTSTSSRRRPSLTHSRVPSGTAMCTPSPAKGDYPVDLTTVGYTSLFVHFDKTPTTPSPFKQKKGNGRAAAATPLTSDVFGNIPIPPVPPIPAQEPVPKPAKRIGMKRFRSLSILRPKKSKQTQQPLPATPPKSAKKTTESAAFAEAKRTKYPGKNAASKQPPSLANELALLQFMEGGTMENNVKKLMEARAKGAGGVGAVGVEGVYRDGKGGIWHDADEEMEYVPLLSPEEDQGEWEDQNDGKDKLEDDFVIVGPIVKTPSPYANVCYPLELVNGVMRRTPTSSRTNTTGSPISPCIANTKSAILTLPSRPNRRNLRRLSLSKAYAHLANAPSYLMDIDAFAPRSPTSKSPRASSSVSFALGTATTKVPKKHRPRPAPLKLSSTQSAHARANAKVALVGLNGKTVKGSSSPVKVAAASGGHKVTGLSPASLERARREFVEDSFRPEAATGIRSPKQGLMRGLFAKNSKA